jgi:hypothetical protein
MRGGLFDSRVRKKKAQAGCLSAMTTRGVGFRIPILDFTKLGAQVSRAVDHETNGYCNVETLSRDNNRLRFRALRARGLGRANAQSEPAKILVGDNMVQALASYQGSDPLPKPFVIVTLVIERIKRAQKGRRFETKE